MAIYHLHASAGGAGAAPARLKVAYIARLGRYKKDRAEVAHFDAGFMPAWAEKDPLAYWTAADTYERANAMRWREIEFALPVELDDTVRQRLASEFARELAQTEGRLPYVFAIHKGKGENPHCHMIMSEHMNDGHDRNPELWFRRAATGKKKTAAEGGARKVNISGRKGWIKDVRAKWADRCNAALAEAGVNTRIDHRSYADQGSLKIPGRHLPAGAMGLAQKGVETPSYKSWLAHQKVVDEQNDLIAMAGGGDGKNRNVAAGRGGEGPDSDSRDDASDARRSAGAVNSPGVDGGSMGHSGGDATESDRRRSRKDRDSSGAADAAKSEGVGMDSDGGGGGGNRGRDKLARFRIASAQRRRAKLAAVGAGDRGKGDTGRTRHARPDFEAARQVDPQGYLESRGYTVKGRGDSLQVFDGQVELYRLDRKARGWVFSHAKPEADGTFKGGDLIDLVREIEHCGPAAAVTILAGAPVVLPESRVKEAVALPPQRPGDREAGRAYLMSRGISAEVLDAAAAAGALAYGRSAVFFVGCDPLGRVKAVTRRDVRPDAKMPRFDLAGSDKAGHPMILPGDRRRVVIVEGGVDALAAQELARRRGEMPPTVIVSGGASCRQFLDALHVRPLITGASEIVVACENEKDAETQARTDALHGRQAKLIKDMAPGAKVGLWHPPAGVKDLGEAAEKAQRHGEAEDLARRHVIQTAPIR